MIESLSLFVAILLSLAVLRSMMFNPRRLEAIGYSLSVLFLQVLIAGYEDIFFICPQFPIYVSPLDANLDPDNTMPDPRAKGVYVDAALLLARCTRVRTDTASGSIADAFRMAYQNQRHNFFSELDITSLEVPLLEERKRCPTRHPRDLEEHVQSIDSALSKAQGQVVAQARILFSSPRFSDQDLVILLATTGEYYRIAVLQRDHQRLLIAPTPFEIDILLTAQRKDASDMGDDMEDTCGSLVNYSIIRKEKHQFEKTRKEEEKKRQDRARDDRAKARDVRKDALSELDALARQRSKFVLDAHAPPYPDGMIEKYFELSELPSRNHQRFPHFFEPEPLPGENINSLAQLRSHTNRSHVVFSGVIRVGSLVSDKYVGMIRAYLAEMALTEGARRAQ